MLPSLRTFLTGALAMGLLALVAAPPALAQSTQAPLIADKAGMFSKGAVDRAQQTVDQIKRNYKKDLLIETYEQFPDGLKAEGLERWAADRYETKRVSGIYIALFKKEGKLWVESGKVTRKKAFTPADRRELVSKMTAQFKEKKFDEGLLVGVNFVESTLRDNVGKASATGKTSVAGNRGGGGGTAMSGIWGWICIGVVVLLGLWLVFALIRAFTGGGGGGGGYGGGGGGGGGFFPSLLGGLFGAAAGMWLYDSFFRSNTPSMGGSAYADSPGMDDDRTAGGGGGGDYGGDDAGGGGGGGDWGGGGDAGGGGDWGGGGDAGGGGGDWGGGGGGGDWGGGGGGGDW